jgi:hypothetical protein
MEPTREELLATLKAAQEAFAASQTPANKKAMDAAQAAFDAFELANPPAAGATTTSNGYPKRTVEEKLPMRIMRIVTKPFDIILKSTGKPSHKVGGLELMQPIVLPNGAKIGILPLSAEQASRIMENTGARSLKELATFVVPSRTIVWVDKLKGATADDESYLPQVLQFEGQVEIAKDNYAEAQKRQRSTFSVAGFDPEGEEGIEK